MNNSNLERNKANNLNQSITNNSSNNKNVPIERNIKLNKNKLFNKIGILDPEGLSPNPLTGEPYKNLYFDPTKNVSKDNPTYLSLAKGWSGYPMYTIKEEALEAIYNNQVILVISGTGSGKTVLTPKFVLHALNYQGRIGITNPKRPPTKENAKFAAKTLDVVLGEEVGMKYRGSEPKHYSASKSKLIYTTDGYIRARLKNDPLLKEFDCIIIDEAHERNVQIDLLLLQLKDLIQVRPDFKLVIMSATVNEKVFIDYFPKNKFKFAMVNAGERPNFPIQEYFLEEFTNFKKPINKFDAQGNLINADDYVEVAVDQVIKIMGNTEKGDILVFFTGSKEIQDGCVKLHNKLQQINKNKNDKLFCQAFSASTPSEMQDILTNAEKYKENGRYTRKVIFATEVVESSITFYGLDFVIDSGLKNYDNFYSEKNLHALEKKYISKASHRQRKGRTGRTGPGTCYNLFTKEEYDKFLDYPLPPILTEDISDSLLQFISSPEYVSNVQFPFKYEHKGGENNIQLVNKNKKKGKLVLKPQEEYVLKPLPLNQYLEKLIKPPQEDSVKRMLDRLIALGVIDIKDNIGTVSDLGRAMAAFDTYPEIGRMLIAGYNYHCRDEICILAAIYNMEDFRFKMDSIFLRFKPSSKDERVKKEEKAKYDRIKKKWTNSMGDQFSLLDIYNEFYLRRYDTVDRRTGRIIKEKKGNAKEWCKENYLHYNTLEKIKQEAKDLQRKFGQVIRIYREKHPENRPTHLFLDYPPQLSDKKDENILMAILDGYYINLLKKTGERRYTNCFPPVKTTAGLTMDSLFAGVKTKYKYALYSELKGIFGRINYSIVCKVPPSLIKKIMESRRGKYVEDCFKKMEEEKQEKRTQKKGKYRGKSRSRSRSKGKSRSRTRK